MTEDLPHPWADYRHLQDELAHSRQVNGRSWGLEAALNRLVAQPRQVPTREDADRVVRTTSRRERHRAALRRTWLSPDEPTPNPEAALDAVRHLYLVKARVTPEDWNLLRAVAEGDRYAEIASVANIAAGALRARVFRLRRHLANQFGLATRSAAG